MRIKTLANLFILISIRNASAQSGYYLELNITTQPTEKITINETGIGLVSFGTIDSKNKVINTLKYKNVGVNYSLQNYDLQNSLNQFTSFGNDFEFSHQLTRKTRVHLNINPMVNFESDFGISDLSVLGGLEANHSINPKNTISIGLKRMTLFGKPEILPTFSFSHQINQNTSVKIGFPNTTIFYSNIRNSFNFTNSFNGIIYNLDSPKVLPDLTTASKISFSQMTSALEYQRNMDSNWLVSLKGGYEFNKKYNLKNKSSESKFDFNSTNGYIFNIGIKYKH